MKLRREVFSVVCVLSLLLSDPRLACAHTLNQVPLDRICIFYEMNGGINDDDNPGVILRTELPFTLALPEREGYNFAGWYTDSSYTDKITELRSDNAAEMMLFAKWTNEIDNHYNVEMYAYGAGTVTDSNLMELRECSYTFWDDVEIPGMPSTRERDYLDNLIASETQCLQGFCFTPEYILMTSYAEGSGIPGSLMIFERGSGSYLATLAMKEESHLGGIAFDGENVWICHSNSTTLERIPYEYIREIAQNAPGYCVDVAALSNEYRIKNTPSCITCYGGRLWVATHTKLFDSRMLSYSYDERTDTLTALGSYSIPCKVQGIGFDDGGAVYLSTSYGRNSSSYLKVYPSLLSLTRHPDDPAMKVEMPPCAEELAVADGSIYVVFESASRKYFEGTDGKGMSNYPLDKVLEVEVASIWQ